MMIIDPQQEVQIKANTFHKNGLQQCIPTEVPIVTGITHLKKYELK